MTHIIIIISINVFRAMCILCIDGKHFKNHFGVQIHCLCFYYVNCDNNYYFMLGNLCKEVLKSTKLRHMLACYKNVFCPQSAVRLKPQKRNMALHSLN